LLRPFSAFAADATPLSVEQRLAQLEARLNHAEREAGEANRRAQQAEQRTTAAEQRAAAAEKQIQTLSQRTAVAEQKQQATDKQLAKSSLSDGLSSMPMPAPGCWLTATAKAHAAARGSLRPVRSTVMPTLAVLAMKRITTSS
jgi:multidrug resistance efflux pump